MVFIQIYKEFSWISFGAMEKVGKTWPSGPERTLFSRAKTY